MDNEPAFTGGCRCGNVRYQAYSSPTDVTFCYCRACQQLSGSGYMPFVDVPTKDLECSSTDSLTSLRLSDVAERKFCSSCGSPISMVYTSKPDSFSLLIGSIHPKSMEGKWPKRRKHIYLREKASWVPLPEDGMPRFEGFSDRDLTVEPYSKPK